MHEKFDSVVIGAGAGGLAMALFLGQTGRKTLIIDKSMRPGGALGSFEKNGYRLDAGFHFTGGLQEAGIFEDILKLLNIREMINPLFLAPDKANIFHFTESGKTINFPYGLERLKKSLKNDFNEESNAIDRYFSDVEKIVNSTPTLQLNTLHKVPPHLPEDSITLKSYINSITENRLLKQTLMALVMCHGSAPSEISFADNARLCQGFYESVATIDGGGNSLVNAFLSEIKKYDIKIKCSDEVIGFADIKDKRVGRLILSSGKEIVSDNIIFTINPKSMLDLLPEDSFPPAFFKRIESFDCTPGFFTVFAALNESLRTEDSGSISSLYPIDDIDTLSLPGWNKPGALAIMHSKSCSTNILTAFEPLYWETVSKWKNSKVGKRPEDYYKWKETKTSEILNRIIDCFPSYKNKIDLITSATPLTYRDYLYHYNGAAYGIKQKVDQFNVMGQLRLRNLYAAGQSAILPGVLGTIMASLLVAKNIVGEDEFIKKIKSIRN